MRLLLDTHIYLWWLQDSRKLSSNAKQKIANATQVYVSSASLWEAAIKIGLGKLDGNIDDLAAQIALSGFIELPIRVVHTAMLPHLPNIHHDPFDRILIAQAICEPLRFVTADKLLKPYSDLVDLV